MCVCFQRWRSLFPEARYVSQCKLRRLRANEAVKTRDVSTGKRNRWWWCHHTDYYQRTLINNKLSLYSRPPRRCPRPPSGWTAPRSPRGRAWGSRVGWTGTHTVRRWDSGVWRTAWRHAEPTETTHTWVLLVGRGCTGSLAPWLPSEQMSQQTWLGRWHTCQPSATHTCKILGKNP